MQLTLMEQIAAKVLWNYYQVKNCSEKLPFTAQAIRRYSKQICDKMGLTEIYKALEQARTLNLFNEQD